MKFKHISVEIQKIISLIFFISSILSSFSQTNHHKPSTLIFVEGGERKSFSSVEENIKSFGLDPINSMIVVYDSKISSIGTNDINNKVWENKLTMNLFF